MAQRAKAVVPKTHSMHDKWWSVLVGDTNSPPVPARVGKRT